MSMYDKNHCNIVISLQLIKKKERKKIFHSCDPHSQGFYVVSEIEVDVFLEFPWFFFDPWNVDNLISGSSAFSKPRMYIWKLLVHVLLKTILKDFDNTLICILNEIINIVVWTFFGIAFLWDWNETGFFWYCGHCWVFQICWHIEYKFHSIIFLDLK